MQTLCLLSSLRPALFAYQSNEGEKKCRLNHGRFFLVSSKRHFLFFPIWYQTNAPEAATKKRTKPAPTLSKAPESIVAIPILEPMFQPHMWALLLFSSLICSPTSDCSQRSNLFITWIRSSLASSNFSCERINVSRVGPIISAIAVGTAPIVATYVTSIVPLVGINVGVTLSLSFAEESGG